MPLALSILLSAQLAGVQAAVTPGEVMPLFNGIDLAGWTVDVPARDTDSSAGDSFVVRDGLLVSLGTPPGHLLTKEKFRDYRLEVEYRFPGKGGNCGVLVHASTPRALYEMFPQSIEVQMNSGDAGDFWCIREDIEVPDMETRRPREAGQKWGSAEGDARRILNLTDGSEKPLGEWNTMVIEARGRTVTVWVNGDLVNAGFDATADRGRIAIQAEGTEVEFRKAEIGPLPLALAFGARAIGASGRSEGGHQAETSPSRSDIQTIESGVLKVAVTSGAPTNPLDPQLWIRRYVERFAEEHHLDVDWVIVPFNESWLLASRDAVDLVATNVASFPDREHPGGTFSAPFLFEQRALRIRPEDEGRFAHIDDFVRKTVGVVVGMAAERDVRRRAPEGVLVRTAETFEELYAEFDAGRLDAIAEAEYFSLDGRVIPSHGDDVVLIDHHDLNPGQREESVFVVRDRSKNLLDAINAFVARTPFPLSPAP